MNEEIRDKIEIFINQMEIKEGIHFGKNLGKESDLTYSRKNFSSLLEFFGQNGLDIPETVSPCLDLQFYLDQLSQQELDNLKNLLVEHLRLYKKQSKI